MDVTRTPPRLGERVWRVRKHYSWMDAQIHDAGAEEGVEVRFLLDGEPVYVRRWPTRDRAVADATNRLHDLQRAGWSTHW